MIEDDYEAAVALATEFEQLRQREEADAELAADMAAGLGTLPGHLPGQEVGYTLEGFIMQPRMPALADFVLLAPSPWVCRHPPPVQSS
jgi:hypothetical protein